MLHAHGRQRLGHDVLHEVHHVLALYEAHLDVHLRELGLTVGAQVLVAKAAGDLVVALDAAHHQHLLELLGALRKRVEAARVRTARHDVVARASGVELARMGVSTSRKPRSFRAPRMAWATLWRKCRA